MCLPLLSTLLCIECESNTFPGRRDCAFICSHSAVFICLRSVSFVNSEKNWVRESANQEAAWMQAGLRVEGKIMNAHVQKLTEMKQVLAENFDMAKSHILRWFWKTLLSLHWSTERQLPFFPETEGKWHTRHISWLAPVHDFTAGSGCPDNSKQCY